MDRLCDGIADVIRFVDNRAVNVEHQQADVGGCLRGRRPDF
jgi:hypothetical protein